MATVVDAARPAVLNGGDYNTTYQKGNDNANTPDPTWLTFMAYQQSVAETSPPATADAAAPIVVQTFLDKTANTVRFS